MRWLWAGAAMLGAAALVGPKIALAALTRSSRAAKLGIANQPDDADDRARLLWLGEQAGDILKILRERWPKAELTSAYRSDALNEATPGASRTSRHRYGLAADFAWNASDYQEAARYLRANIKRLRVKPRTILPELPSPHLHIDYYDPLRKLDAGTGPTTFNVRVELNKYIALA